MNAVSLWFFPHLLPHREVLHFVSGRTGGVSTPPYDSLNLAFHVGDAPGSVAANRKILAHALAIDPVAMVAARQVHGNTVAILDHQERRQVDEEALRADALVTDIPGTCLMVLLADCVPVLIVDPIKRVVGVAHAGWRGTVKLVASETVRVLTERYGSSPKDLFVGIGPSIGPDEYEIGPEVIAEVERVFGTKRGFIRGERASDGKGLFDLWEANKVQLVRSGVPEDRIQVARLSTYQHPYLFFSERRLGGPTGRFAAGVMIRARG